MLSILSKIFGIKNKSEMGSDDLVEMGVCPNCWGTQVYQNQYREYIDDPTLANTLKNKDRRKAFIAQFVEDRITGIKLHKQGDNWICKTCKSGFKTVH